jgi:hypothetical protein
MLTQTRRILATLFLIASLAWGLGCTSVDDEGVVPDTDPPAIPRGVESITDDGQVIIFWFPNGESDLAGYKVWRSADDKNFDLLAEVDETATEYIDRDVRNGETYFYAVSAIDFDGNESEFSPELASATPRPSGRNVILDDATIHPERSGFDFSRPEKGAIPWDSPATDIYFGFDPEQGSRILYSDNNTRMQDLGYYENIDDIYFAPEHGYVRGYVELFRGHAYALRAASGNYAKIHITAISDDDVTFDWAYQMDPDNPQLAPPLHQR